MGVSTQIVERLESGYPGLRALAFDTTSAEPVLAVGTAVTGITGGGSSLACRYELIINTTDLRAAIPTVWVTSPADAAIKHVNIWRAKKSFCVWTGTNLPSFCWYQYANLWTDAPSAVRTLGAVLEYVKQFLNTENHDSPAR
jgi:hypothetical protein